MNYFRAAAAIPTKKEIYMKPSKTWKNKPCLRPYRKDKINLRHPSHQLQMVDYRPHPKGFWPFTPPKCGCHV